MHMQGKAVEVREMDRVTFTCQRCQLVLVWDANVKSDKGTSYHKVKADSRSMSG